MGKGSGKGGGGAFETWTIQLGIKPVSRGVLEGPVAGTESGAQEHKGRDSCGGAPLKESSPKRPSFATPATGSCS